MSVDLGWWQGKKVIHHPQSKEFRIDDLSGRITVVTEEQVMQSNDPEAVDLRQWLGQTTFTPQGPNGLRAATGPIFGNRQSVAFEQEMVTYLVDLPNDTVLLWVSEFAVGGRTNSASAKRRFTYVAIKAQGQWYTTASDANTRVGQIMDNGALATILVADDTVQISTQPTRWTQVI